MNVAHLLKLYIHRYFKNIKDIIKNAQSRRSGEKAHHMYEKYKNTVMPHGRHIYSKSSDMDNATMRTYPHSDHALPHWKHILRCCDECPRINISDQVAN